MLDAMASHGLKRGENGLEIYVMCEIPNNVIQIDAFAQAVRRLLDRLQRPDAAYAWVSIGIPRSLPSISTNAIPACWKCFRLAVVGAKRNGRHVGICGEAPANYPEIARYLTQLGIDSISVNPSSILRTMQVVSDAENATPASSRA